MLAAAMSEKNAVLTLAVVVFLANPSDTAVTFSPQWQTPPASLLALE